jgi:hypothetical protein
MILLGDRVKNKVNGMSGITTGRTEYINGCRQHLVMSEALDKDGKSIDSTWWDEQYLEVVDQQVLKDPFAVSVQPAIAGGPSGSTERAIR